MRDITQEQIFNDAIVLNFFFKNIWINELTVDWDQCVKN